MQTLTATDLSRSYGEKVLFNQINFLIHDSDKIGLIGLNGTGKTTLLNTIAGLEKPDSGVIETPNQYKVSYLRQDNQLPNVTVLEAALRGEGPEFEAIRTYERILKAYSLAPNDQKIQDQFFQAENDMNRLDAWQIDTELKTILTGLHITDFNQRTSQLSGGQVKRVALAQALLDKGDLLILDEPTNHLDFDSIAWLEKYLQSYRGALLVVTHDRYFLDAVTNQIFELDQGRLSIFPGNYEAYVTQKAHQDEVDAAQAHKQKQLYKQELAWMHAGAKARTTKQQARIERFKDLKANLPTGGGNEDVSINIGEQRLGKKVIELKDANLNFDDKVILKDFNLLVQAGDRIGITGVNGAGKSSLLNVIAGKIPLDTGILTIGETVKMAYYTQITEPIDPNKRVIKYLEDVGESVTSKSGTQISVTQLLEEFLFPRFMHGTLIARLSGGELRRLYLLKLLMSEPNVLLLDEPTNDFDVQTLTVLENYLADFNGTVITVSHDRYFLDQVTDQLLIFNGSGSITRYQGQLSDYLKAQAASQGAEKTKQKTQASANDLPTETKKTAKKHKLTYNEQKEYAGIEGQLDQLDQQIQQLKAQMTTVPGTDYQKLADLQQQIDHLNQEVDQKMDRWAYLSEFA
ncbi:ABC transporter family protein [Agrilactobacillus composti DSM 18527 = JCM 14202]|uniref:ABC transporter family protein n=1 Tax=Agrilactobacillus composti DSM 18527 = JCM 14202 TaxID=1423734 RepID=X0PDG2_9LACO|nr:ABC-F family ATP-binding cassette domain-containing protein [Agrilactobacillus composti]KRM36547.1 ABC transporter family protein [Agrilactobacillus composti DSM 18527 = JCM 14202]GAF39139.1 ATPase components of ABC transporters with duplicated ATPase domains [Agrilactobacillus composti DSM 18527 = JCM 14202]